jgi:hypothetical protein
MGLDINEPRHPGRFGHFYVEFIEQFPVHVNSGAACGRSRVPAPSLPEHPVTQTETASAVRVNKERFKKSENFILQCRVASLWLCLKASTTTNYE